MAWTSPRTWTTGETVTAAMMNEQVRDNSAYLKGDLDAKFPVTPANTDFFTDDKIYSGRVAGTGSGIKLPTGWSITKLATGKYRINHTMGTANFTFTGNANNKFVVWVNKTSTTIEIHVLGEAAGVMGYYDAEWHFIIIQD